MKRLSVLMVLFSSVTLNVLSADPAAVLTLKQAKQVKALLEAKRSFVRRCEDDKPERVDVQNVAFRGGQERYTVSVNGKVESFQCAYVKESGGFVHVLKLLGALPAGVEESLDDDDVAELYPEDDFSALAADVVKETNLMRKNPAAYARYIEEQLPYYQGRRLTLPGRPTIVTAEGRAAADEAIRALKAASPLPSLSSSEALVEAARDHVRDQGRSGAVSHTGSDRSSPFDRMKRHGARYGFAAENIAYGLTSARAVLIGLIVDDGVPSRGHRKTLLDGRLRRMGVVCGPHKGYELMCVQDFTDR